jgi:excisionase family DNA binding protein
MKYLTKDEVATLLRVSVRTITVYMSQGRLPPPVQLGRKLLWNEDALVGFLNDAIANSVAESSTRPAKRGRPRKLVVR